MVNGYCLFIVALETDIAEDHPEVIALVEEAIREIEHVVIEPQEDQFAEVLQQWITKVWLLVCNFLEVFNSCV